MRSMLNETREAILREVGRLSMDEMRSPYTKRLYGSAEIIDLVSHRLTSEQRGFLQKASRLSKVSLQDSVDRAIAQRRTLRDMRRSG
jgi:hypothetical protein